MSTNLIPLDEYEQDELADTDDVWRPCPNYPGYDASWNGWVRSWIVPNHTVHGYYYEVWRVNPRVNGEVLNRNRAQLVADAFLVQPEPKWQLRFLDDDHRNAKASNLDWEERYDRLRRNETERRLNPNRTRQTHCKWGHELNDETVRLTGEGSNMCVVCARAHASRYGEIRTLKKKGEPHEHVTFEYVLKRKGVWVPESERPKITRTRRNQRLLEGRRTRKMEENHGQDADG